MIFLYIHNKLRYSEKFTLRSKSSGKQGVRVANMKFIKYIITVPFLLNVALWISILSVIIMQVFLFDIPEVVSWCSEFGEVFYKLCLSIMASYIFYFIVVHLKSEKDKENINAFIATKSFNVVGDYKSQINEFIKISGKIFN